MYTVENIHLYICGKLYMIVCENRSFVAEYTVRAFSSVFLNIAKAWWQKNLNFIDQNAFTAV